MRHPSFRTFEGGPRPTVFPCILFRPAPEGPDADRLFPHGPKGRGRLEDYSLSWPGGPGRRKTICGYVPFLAQHWAYGSIPGFMAPFWPPSGLWFRSGSILALWFRFGLLVKSCAKQRRPRPEHTGGGICLAQILYKRGLLIRLQKRKIISEENLIVRWS